MDESYVKRMEELYKDRKNLLKKVKSELEEAHKMFSDADEANHAYLEVAEDMINKILDGEK